MVRQYRFLGVVALLLLSGIPEALGAQSLSSGSMGGVVLDGAGEPVSGASITLENEASGLTRSVTVARDGRFQFPVLSPGEYSLRAEQFGYVPQVLLGVVVRPGRRGEVSVTLSAATGTVERVDTLSLRGALLAGAGPGFGLDLPAARLERYPHQRRELTELGRYSSLSGPELEMQGLPAAMSGIRVDGMAVGTLESPGLLPGSLRSAAFPLSMFELTSVVATDPDVEWSEHAGGALNAFTTRGGRVRGVEAFGLWAPGALVSGTSGADAAAGQSLHAGVLVGGPLIPDTASMVLGVEARRLSESGPVFGSATDEALRVARDVYDLDPGADPYTTDVFSTFGHLAWQVSPNSLLDARVSAALVPSSTTTVGVTSPAGRTRPYDGRDIFAGATLTTRFSDRVYQEARLAVDGAARSYDDVDGLGLNGPTRFPADGGVLGPGESGVRSLDRWTVRASEAIHLVTGDHRLKLGLSVTLPTAEIERGTVSEVFFATLDDFSAGEGFLVQTEPGPGGSDFAVPRAGLFVQDTWSAGTGLEILLGLRLDVERLPVDRVGVNQEWLDLTGLDNTDVAGTWLRLAPRFGFSWDLQDRHEWVMSGSAGIYSGTTDPLLLEGWISGSGNVGVRRGFGSLDGWPATRADGAEFSDRPALAFLDPGFEAPRTVRADLGISRMLGSETVLRLAGLYRYTDFLPRFSDLNLAPDPLGQDQDGRPLFGELRQRGSLLYTVPSSNRRFVDFDQVIAIGTDGWSAYRGLTASLETQRGSGIDLFASYTFSQTEDNWTPSSGNGSGIPLPPRVGPTGSDWMEGRSDLDVPHRAVAGMGLSLDALAGIHSALLYRYRSGYPFTPGFRDGIDANADGSIRNDPAFVDLSVSGAEGLAGQWECLRDAAGRFADRNACRADGVHSLDARIAIGVARLGRYSAELVVDGLNLLAAQQQYPDAALYLVDPAGSLKMDAATGRTTVPLIANPNFGQPLGTFGSERMLRLGFRLMH